METIEAIDRFVLADTDIAPTVTDTELAPTVTDTLITTVTDSLNSGLLSLVL